MRKPWPQISLSEVLTQYPEYINAPAPKTYPKLSVKLYGKGVVLDAPVDGTSLKMKRHQIAKAGQVILSEIWGKKGAIGFVPPAGDGALCTSHFFLFDVSTTRIEPKYLQAVFTANYLQDQLDFEAKGTTGYAAVRPKHLLGARIPLPPLSEQRRIVNRIEELSAKIEEAGRLRHEAIGATDALFIAYMSATVKTIPASGRLADVLIEPPRNGWSARCDNMPTGVAVLSLGAVTGFEYRPAKFKRTSEPTSPNSHYWLKEDDLLITRSNTPELVGHAAIYDGSPTPCIYPDLMMRLPVDESRAHKRFVHRWLMSIPVRDYIASHAKGTSPTMKKVSQGVVMNIPFPSQLSLDNQRRLYERWETFRAAAHSLGALQADAGTELDALVPSILSKAFSGDL